MIKENLEIVESNIRKACEKAGRERSEVTLIAVSKTKPVEALREAMDCGIRVFGENKVQEMKDKNAVITEDLDWHMIGHLQANKVKYLPGMACMIHSVDNIKLAQEIEKQFAKNDMKIDVLIEVNMAGEDTKFGLAPQEVVTFVKEISALPHLNIRGLMTIAPYTEDPESNRQYFRGLRELKDEINGMNILPVPMDTLSMGMTGDYQIAIEEGATFVRVGTGIFGERDYSLKS
ncbi:YggS family pyridoxal phosphate-dependent enzyme [Butyrivibrio sp. MC2021]|uniref:YggS family pyridoxal phosphate-dependent enzyme n=1 Tax=Butyrivibrio sp. MC2021 TaxID=1408306 RepID=UPI00047A9787|nr:YggS family pyridoxal phosphate-dependent enzyme [Butyrivibrio sp. MC2021]